MRLDGPAERGLFPKMEAKPLEKHQNLDVGLVYSMVLQVFPKLNGSVVSEREYGDSQVMSLKMQVGFSDPCCCVHMLWV